MKHLFFTVFIVLSCTVFYSFTPQSFSENDPLPCVNKSFPITLQIIRDSLGNNATSISDAQDVIDEMNSFFNPICVSFYIFDTRIIYNHTYDEIDDAAEYNELISTYNKPSRINVYIGNYLGGSSFYPGFSTYNGITEPSANLPSIAINKPSFTAPQLAHFIGEYFGLRPTGYANFGNELADGSNCATTGDLMCSTPADPFGDPITGQDIDYPYYLRERCKFVFQDKDANDQFYNPDVSNIMSYYINCRCTFTHEQYEFMALTYYSNSGNTW